MADAGVTVARALARADDAVERFLQRDDRAVRVSAFHSAGVALFGRPLTARGAVGPELLLSDEDVAQEDFPRLTADYDLVVAHRLPHQPQWPADRVAVRHLFQEPLDIALARDHPLARRQQLRPTDPRGQRWVAVHEGFPLRGVLGHVSAVVGEPARIAHQINEFFVATEVVAAGSAIAIMLCFSAQALENQGVVLRPLRDVRLTRVVDVLARPENLERTSVQRALHLVEHVAADLRAEYDVDGDVDGPTASPV